MFFDSSFVGQINKAMIFRFSKWKLKVMKKAKITGLTLVYIDKAIKNNVLKQCASTLSVNSYYTLNS